MAELGGESVVTEECLHELLDFFIKSAYKARTADRRVKTLSPQACNMHAEQLT